MEREILWRFECGSGISGCPGVIDTNDAPLIIAATDGGTVHAIRGDGTLAWTDDPGGVMQAWPVVAELPRGRTLLLGEHRGLIHAYTPDGTRLWTHDLGDIQRSELFNSGLSPWSGFCAIHGGDASIVVSDRGGRVSGIDENGELAWRVFFDSETGIPAVGDIDGDGADEIIVSTLSGRLHCLSVDGTWRWSVRAQSPEGGYHAPLILGVGREARIVTLGESDGMVRCLNAAGTILWESDTKGAISAAGGASPFVVDGETRLFVANSQSVQVILDPEGNELWRGHVSGGNQPFGPSIADVDGDGRPEFVITRRAFGAKTLWILDADGNERAKWTLDSGMTGAPVIADVNGDGIPEIITWEESTGIITVSRVASAVPGGIIQWPTGKGPFDGQRSVLPDPISAVPESRGGDTVGALELREPSNPATGPQALRIGGNPDREPKILQTRISTPGHAEQLTIRNWNAEDHGILDMTTAGTYSISATAHDASGQTVASGEWTIDFTPFAREKTDGEGLLRELDDMAGDQADLLRDRWMGFIARMATTGDPERLARQIHEWTANVHRFVTLNRLAADRDGTHMLLWQPEHPWIAHEPRSETPDGGLLESLHVTTEQNAHEASAISIANISGRTLSVRIWIDEDGSGPLPPAGAIALRRHVFVPTATGNVTPDAIPRLDRSGVLTIPRDETARLWIDWSSELMTPGTWHTRLNVRALADPAQVWEIPVEWNVLPISLPAQSPLWFHVWAYENAMLGDARLAYADLLDHHVNVFDLPVPKALYDAKGTIVRTDFSACERVIKRVPRGSFFIWNGRETIVQPNEDAPPIGSDAWVRAFKAFVPQWVEFLQSHSVDYDHHTNYILDEPGIEGGKRVNELVRVAKLFKAIDPHLSIFANPAGGATEEHIDRLFAVTDLFDPIWQYPGDYRHLAKILKHRMRVWTYACGDGAKDRTRMQYYWAPIWRGMQVGLTGLGFWSYAGRQVDLWQGEAPTGCDWEMVYQADGTIVPSHRWQGLRIGIEDYARLWMLERVARQASRNGDTATAEDITRKRRAFIDRVAESGMDEGVAAQVRAEVQRMLVELKERESFDAEC
jgi:hypothetical protein